MKVTDLDGNHVKWTPVGASSKDTRAKSSYHEYVRNLLKDMFPTITILEEVSVPIRRGQTNYLDFYCPMLKTAIEVHGEQHYKFIPHFHQTIQGFAKQRKRDNEKVEWCEVNGITIIVLPFNEQTQWTSHLKEGM